MAQTQKISKNNTAIYTSEDGSRQVFLHKTCIVQVGSDGTIKLNTGGWLTVTTCTRMNQVAREWGLDYTVSRAKGAFHAYIPSTGNTIQSTDNRTLTLNGKGE